MRTASRIVAGWAGDRDKRTNAVTAKAASHARNPSPLDPRDKSITTFIAFKSLDGGLFFATSDALENRVREVALSMPEVTGIVLDCGG